MNSEGFYTVILQSYIFNPGRNIFLCIMPYMMFNIKCFQVDPESRNGYYKNNLQTSFYSGVKGIKG